jgi:hypothetical protein
MVFDLSTILYMAVAFYLVVGLGLGVILITAGTWIVKRISPRVRERMDLLQRPDDLPGFEPPRGTYRQFGRA